MTSVIEGNDICHICVKFHRLEFEIWKIMIVALPLLKMEFKLSYFAFIEENAIINEKIK